MRAFAGIPLSPATVQRLSELKNRLDGSGADIAWVRPENLHMTLAFLGDITQEQAERASAAMAGAAVRHSSFPVQFDCVGAFPGERFPRILWAGIRAGAERMVALGEDVRAGLNGIGQEEDKPFVPHVTVGRVQSAHQGRGLRERLAQIQSVWVATPVETIGVIRLYESKLERSGPTYRAAGEWPLGAPSK